MICFLVKKGLESHNNGDKTNLNFFVQLADDTTPQSRHPHVFSIFLYFTGNNVWTREFINQCHDHWCKRASLRKFESANTLKLTSGTQLMVMMVFCNVTFFASAPMSFSFYNLKQDLFTGYQFVDVFSSFHFWKPWPYWIFKNLYNLVTFPSHNQNTKG